MKKTFKPLCRSMIDQCNPPHHCQYQFNLHIFQFATVYRNHSPARGRPIIQKARLKRALGDEMHRNRLRSADGLCGQGDLILGRASRLVAFSGYAHRTWLPGYAAGATTGAPEVPARNVPLTVRLLCAFTLCARFSAVMREPRSAFPYRIRNG